MIGSIVTATPDHAKAMAPNVRSAEIQEIADASGLGPEQQLLADLSRSSVAWAWIIDGEVACMFGVIAPSLVDATSYPWFLTTPLVEKHSRAFARACRTLLPELLAHHPRMVGMVDARYLMSIRWLGWLGARIAAPAPWGVTGALFCQFVLGEEVAVPMLPTEQDKGDMLDYVNRLEAEMTALPQADIPVWNHFAPGVYARTILIRKGVALTGAVHKTEHLCIVSGDHEFTTDSGLQRITHPHKIISSKPGTKRAGYSHEDTYFTTVHATTETNLEKLVQELCESTAQQLIGGSENKQMMHNRLKG